MLENQVRELSIEEVRQIYDQFIVKHFQKEEIKPWKHIERMWLEECYLAYGMMQTTEHEEKLVGYMFFVKIPDCDMLLLDYFAVLEQYRSLGIGRKFLKETTQKLGQCKGILIETEDLACAKNQTERIERQRRDAFYEKLNARKIGITTRIFNAQYVIWVLYSQSSTPFNQQECVDNLQMIYRRMLPGALYEEGFRILS